MGFWKAYVPSAAQPWNLKRVVHLHRRAAWGATWDEIERDVADVVYGSRFLGKTRQGSVSLYYLGNQFLTGLSNVITRLRVTDVWVGYKVFRRDVLQKIRLREDRFGFEPEVTAKIAKLGCRVVEVPVSYTARSREDGKKIGWKDAVRGVWCTLRYTLVPESMQR